MTTILRVDCPRCAQPIEAPEGEARFGVICPTCSTRFLPTEIGNVGKRETQPDKARNEQKLADRGNTLWGLSILCFVATALCLILGIMTIGTDINGRGFFYL